MHTPRITTSFLTATVLACGLVIGGFAPPALAKTIVVTTLADTANPPFDADGPCGTGSISDLPGSDSQVSLREAIIAANNTPGADTITFATGGTITVSTPLPALCGGQTTINGDLNGDDDQDITLEGAAIPAAAPPVAAAGLLVLSSHNTITGLRVQHFPIGIRIRAGDFTTARAVEHTKVTNNIVAESRIDGIDVRTGNVPGSLVAHTTLTQNEVLNNVRNGILVIASLSGTGADSQIDHTTLTDNEVTGSGQIGIFLLSAGDRNIISDATVARNTVFGSAFFGINVNGGFNGADENNLDLRINDNTVTDNGIAGIRVIAGQDNSSNNHVVALIRGNTVEGHQLEEVATVAAQGAVSFPTGISNNNLLNVRIVQNTVRIVTGNGIGVGAGLGSLDGHAGAAADGNQISAVVVRNMVKGNTVGIGLAAGGAGLANANTAEVRVADNTVCNNVLSDIGGEGSSTGSPGFSPNLGTGNVLTGEITKNTATTVTVADGVPGNTADVTQFKNEPCP